MYAFTTKYTKMKTLYDLNHLDKVKSSRVKQKILFQQTGAPESYVPYCIFCGGETECRRNKKVQQWILTDKLETTVNK